MCMTRTLNAVDSNNVIVGGCRGRNVFPRDIIYVYS